MKYQCLHFVLAVTDSFAFNLRMNSTTCRLQRPSKHIRMEFVIGAASWALGKALASAKDTLAETWAASIRDWRQL